MRWDGDWRMEDGGLVLSEERSKHFGLTLFGELGLVAFLGNGRFGYFERTSLR